MWFERAIVARVESGTREAVRDVATQAATEAATNAARETTEALRPRLDEVDRLLSEKQSKNHAAQSEAVSTLGIEASRSAMLELLARATDMRAIALGGGGEFGYLVVCAGEGVNAPRIEVQYSPGAPGGEGPDEPVLSMLNRGERDSAKVKWDVDEDAVTVFERLRDAMIRAGRGALVRDLSIKTFFENLRSGLQEALGAREHLDGAWLSGEPVHEFLSEGWAITDNGLEVRGRGVPIQRHEFGGWNGATFVQSTAGSPPEGIDEELWALALQSGSLHLRTPTW